MHPDPGQERRKRRREIAIILVSILLLGILTFIEIKAFQEIPRGEANLLAYVLLQVNAILLLVVAYLVIRNVLKLFFDREKGRIAERLRTRLTVAFLFLALVPTIFLFLVSIKFIETSLEFWFSSNLDRSLEEALLEARSIYQEKERELAGKADEFIKRYLKKTRRLRSKHVKEWRKRLGLDTLEVYAPSGRLIKGAYRHKPDIRLGVPPSILKKVFEEGEAVSETSKFKDKVLLRVFIPGPYQGKTVAVATGVFLDPSLEKLISEVGKGLEAYQQLKFFKDPLKSSLLLVLLLVTLLTIFVALWFGMRFARRLTAPVQALAEATSQIASGNFDVELPPESPDEVGRLVKAFRRMTEELKAYRAKVEETTTELKRRTWYLETVLANITAGVVALDEHGHITFINRVAARLFGAHPQRLVGQMLEEVLPEEYREKAREMLAAVRLEPRRLVQQPVSIEVRGQRIILAVTITLLEAEDGRSLGYLCLFEDITEKERIQRLAAWREVARRIAHEVKNPLTPIQLSAQRLRRRLTEALDEENRQILERCTTTIEKQVEELKHLVNEFSAFARLPSLKLEEADLEPTVREVMDLYREGHPDIEFSLEVNGESRLRFDREQMKRVFLNLFDNAIRAMEGKGHIRVRLCQEDGFLRVEVRDTGPGIPSDIKDRLFEPYFSGHGGSGLGLAIVSSIVQEHQGNIQVEECSQGACFVLKLPLN